MKPTSDSIAIRSGLLSAVIGTVKKLYNVYHGYGHVVTQKINTSPNSIFIRSRSRVCIKISRILSPSIGCTRDRIFFRLYRAKKPNKIMHNEGRVPIKKV